MKIEKIGLKKKKEKNYLQIIGKNLRKKIWIVFLNWKRNWKKISKIKIIRKFKKKWLFGIEQSYQLKSQWARDFRFFVNYQRGKS